MSIKSRYIFNKPFPKSGGTPFGKKSLLPKRELFVYYIYIKIYYCGSVASLEIQIHFNKISLSLFLIQFNFKCLYFKQQIQLQPIAGVGLEKIQMYVQKQLQIQIRGEWCHIIIIISNRCITAVKLH